MVDHRGLNIDEINNHVEEIIKIDDVYVPHSIRGAFLGMKDVLRDKMFENQKEFIIDYRYDRYWRKGETRFEMDQRLIREFIDVHPELEILLPKTGVTVEEHQEKMKKLYPEAIPYDYTPR